MCVCVTNITQGFIFYQCAAGRELKREKKKRGRGAAAPAKAGQGGISPLRGLRGRAPSGVWGRAPCTTGSTQCVKKARRRRGGLGAEPPQLKQIFVTQ